MKMAMGSLSTDTISTAPCGNLTLPGLPLDLPLGTVKPACENRLPGKPCPAHTVLE